MCTRYTCPQCHHHKIFVRYIDTENGNQLDDTVGRCSREDKCGYHYKPAEYFKAHGLRPEGNVYKPPVVRPVIKPGYLPLRLVQRSLNYDYYNCFISYLLSNFEADATWTVLRRYHIGTSKYWMGAVIFWQIDQDYNVHTGKVMLYDVQTGKRVKRPYNHIQWVHKLYGNPVQIANYNLVQCFFGEHLLKSNKGPVAICESEKSAIIAAICYPQLTWLAAGSIAGLTPEKCKCLANRKVILVPDLNGFEKWHQKALAIAAEIPSVEFKVMDFLEQHAGTGDREQGLDIADFMKC